MLPGVRAVLFESAGRPGYARLKLPLTEVKPAILGHAEFAAFKHDGDQALRRLAQGHHPAPHRLRQGRPPQGAHRDHRRGLLATFRQAPLLDAYDIYQHLMDYWAETMQDDAYLIAADGWVKGAQPREIVQVKNKDNKLVWPEPHDYLKGKRRFKSDLVPAAFSSPVTSSPNAMPSKRSTTSSPRWNSNSTRCARRTAARKGCLAEVIEGEGDKQKISRKGLKARLKEIGEDPERRAGGARGVR